MPLSAGMPLQLDDLYRLCDATSPRAQSVSVEAMPEPYRSLLAHESHMTVTLEEHHRTVLRLEVLQEMRQGHLYGRKILLTHGDTGAVLQFGIMRIDLRCCTPEIGNDILAAATPLGRILVEHGTLRRISTHGLLRIVPDEELRRHFGLAAESQGPVYGRLATIFCDGEPAIGLLEVVAPTSGGSAQARALPK